MDELIKNFRQWGSHTAGHPEIDQALGIEMTTGPLGRDSAPGWAWPSPKPTCGPGSGPNWSTIAPTASSPTATCRRASAPRRPRWPGTWVGDGSLLLRRQRDLDRRRHRQDVHRGRARSVPRGRVARPEVDGHDREAIAAATVEAQVEDRPSLIVCHTVIAKGAPTKAGTAGSHGPAGRGRDPGAKEAMGFPVDETFHVPDGSTSSSPRR
jgi:transketolase